MAAAHGRGRRLQLRVAVDYSSRDAITHAAIANPPDDPAHHLEIRAEKGVRPGGFGILLTRNLVDELIYNEKGNEVLFIKYLK